MSSDMHPPNNAILPGQSSSFVQPIDSASGCGGDCRFRTYSVLVAPQALVEGSVALRLLELLEADHHGWVSSFSFSVYRDTVSFGPSLKQAIHNIIYFADTKRHILQDEECHRSTGRCRATPNA